MSMKILKNTALTIQMLFVIGVILNVLTQDTSFNMLYKNYERMQQLLTERCDIEKKLLKTYLGAE